jgi:hypothetical protein
MKERTNKNLNIFKLSINLLSITQLRNLIIDYKNQYGRWPKKILLDKKNYMTYLDLTKIEDIRHITFLGIPVEEILIN